MLTPTKQTKNITTPNNSTLLLERAIKATKQTDCAQTKDLLSALVQNALNGTIVWDKSVVSTISQAIKKIDQALSKQLSVIIHEINFSKLEGSWRGLHHLVSQTNTSVSLYIKVLNITKKELHKDLDRAVEFDQSVFFKKIYENEFGMPGGQPYSVLIGDYEFDQHPENIAMLSKISNVAAAAFCPFITAASATFMGFDDWSDLADPRDLSTIFDSCEYNKWQNFRASEDARFVCLTMPRVLARLPYGQHTHPIEAFDFEETTLNHPIAPKQPSHTNYCWMNAAYTLGVRITEAFENHGWSTAIRGAHGGGKVENLPLHCFATDDGDIDAQCPTEIGISDRREAELSQLGFLPLCHYKNTDYAVYFGGQSVQKPNQYDSKEATANAEISARLPYLLATSRFAHYIKIMARDKVGSFMEPLDCEMWLNRWISQYVNGNPDSNQTLKAKYPLAAAKITVNDIPGKPGSYNATAWLKPWLQFEELTTSMRMVAQIPKLT
jgi:type VI secretion system protein ImpC